MACMTLSLHRNMYLVTILLQLSFLLIMSSLAQGRPFHDATLGKDQENAATMRLMIGSRPPRCDQRCEACGHCEAVQVPIAPPIKFIDATTLAAAAGAQIVAYSRGEDISNYKPMCWKCKCGDFIFNPEFFFHGNMKNSSGICLF